MAIVQLNPYLERLLSFVHVLPPTAYTIIIESCKKLENSMFNSKYLDDILSDMGLTRIYLDPNILFEELVVYNRILISMQETCFIEHDNYYNDNIIAYIDEIETIEGIPFIEDDDELPAPATILAAFAHDAQNVHTAPAQSETARAIQVLMDSHSCESLFEEWLIIAGIVGEDSDTYIRLNIREHLMNDSPQEFFIGIPPYDGFITHVSFQDIFYELWSYARKQSALVQIDVARDILIVVINESEHERLKEMARIICKYIP